MPETYFYVEWPDGQKDTCYSPSSVVKDYFQADTRYALDDFVSLSEKSLKLASERVREKYGYYCSSAADQLSKIQRSAERFKSYEQPEVTVLKVSGSIRD